MNNDAFGHCYKCGHFRYRGDTFKPECSVCLAWAEARIGESHFRTRRDRYICAALTGYIAGIASTDVIDSYDGDPVTFAEHQQLVVSACVGYADAAIREADKEESHE